MPTKRNTIRVSKSIRQSTLGTAKVKLKTVRSASAISVENEDAKVKVEKPLSRTELLVLDYKKFKAARVIQKWVRCWLARRRYRRLRCAAIIIQRDWRRYSVQRKYFKILEQRVQDEIDSYHRNAAIRIQAYWRGFLVREHIHDQYRMKRSQRMAAEDLMHCIAYKLHYLLRTYQIPGIYSLRNSTVLSRVEKMLVSISFRQTNKRALLTRIQREAFFQESRREYKESAYGTRVPYAGPNFSGICDPKCQRVYKEIDIDARMHMILRKYMDENVKQQQQHHIRCWGTSRRSSPPSSLTKKIERATAAGDFCSDIVKSMRRWDIVAPNKLEVRSDIFKNPENVEKFLSEVESILSFMSETNTCCNVDTKKLREGVHLEDASSS